MIFMRNVWELLTILPIMSIIVATGAMKELEVQEDECLCDYL